MTVVSTTQMTLDFEAGISEGYGSLKEFLREGLVPYKPAGLHRKQLAAELDLSPSELSRKLGDNPKDPRNFTIDDLERYIQVTGQPDPIYYLCDKFLKPEDEIARLKARVAELEGQGSTSVHAGRPITLSR